MGGSAGMAITGGTPGAGGTLGTGGVAPTGGSGGAIVVVGCSAKADCMLCCDSALPASPPAAQVFSQKLYGCGCSACSDVCGDSLCNTNSPLPSLPCLSCMKKNAGAGECLREWSMCLADTVCVEFANCAGQCL
jgi:hypothetical protein